MSAPGLVCVKCRHNFVPGDETWVFIHDELPWLNHAIVQCPSCGFTAAMKMPFPVLQGFLKYDMDSGYDSGIHFVFLDDESRRDADDMDDGDDYDEDIIDAEVVDDDDRAESVLPPAPPSAPVPAEPEPRYGVRVVVCPKCHYRYPLNSGYCYFVLYDAAEHFDHLVGRCPNPACGYRQRFFDRQLVEAVAEEDDNIREYWFITPGPRMIRAFRCAGLEVEADPADLAELKVFFRDGIPAAWASQGFRPDVGGPDSPRNT
jgi:RNase P subunit RPR2